MWIAADELDLLDAIFEPEELIPRNQKGNFKLRHISFFNTGAKAITNICKNLERVAMHDKGIAHQYIEALRKMGVLNKNEEITKYGEMLLKIMYYDNNRIIDEMSQPNISVSGLSEDIPFVIEFFLFSVVKKCLDSQLECDACGIVHDDLAEEPMDSIKYFFSNIIDTIKEPTNKNNNLNALFSFDNDEFYYTIQGMNFSGYEVKRLFRLPPNDMQKAWKAYSKVLSTVKTTNQATLTSREKRYYEYANYYDKLVQKDVRNRVKLSIINYILLDSIATQRNKIKIVHKKEYDAIIPHAFIEEVFEKYKLKEVYNLVYYEKDSKYITNQIKPLAVSDQVVTAVDGSKMFVLQEGNLRNQHVNLGDEIMFTSLKRDQILRSYVYKILEMRKQGTDIEIDVEKREEMNKSMEDKIIDRFKED